MHYYKLYKNKTNAKTNAINLKQIKWIFITGNYNYRKCWTAHKMHLVWTDIKPIY